VLHLKKVQIVAKVADASLGQAKSDIPAVDLLIPDGWTFKSNVSYNNQEGCFDDLFAIAWEATSPDGGSRFQGAPAYSWQYSTNPSVLHNMNDPNRRALGAGNKPCTVAEPMSARQYFQQKIQPRGRGDQRCDRERPAWGQCCRPRRGSGDSRRAELSRPEQRQDRGTQQSVQLCLVGWQQWLSAQRRSKRLEPGDWWLDGDAAGAPVAVTLPSRYGGHPMRFVLRLLWIIGTLAFHAGRIEAAAAGEAIAPKVALVTFAPGENYWERFGHNAILVEDAGTGERLGYNYGVFDFEESHFLWNFARGYMHYSLYAGPADEAIAMYVADGRSVTVQMLNLTPAQARRIAAYLAWNAQPKNAVYRYDYFLNNCSTRLRDVLNDALGGELNRQLAGRLTPRTYRFDGGRLILPEFWFALAVDMGLGPKADRPLNVWQESFVPMALSDALDSVVTRDVDGNAVPLVSQKEIVFAGSMPPAGSAPRDLRLPFLVIGLGMAGSLFCLARSRARLHRAIFGSLVVAWWMISGICGLLLFGLWAFSDHWAAWQNENLLLFSPLCLAMPMVWWRAPSTGRYLITIIAALALVGLCLRTLPGFYQSNLAFVALTLPVHLALALSAWRSGSSRTRKFFDVSPQGFLDGSRPG
jgi:uncharacterized protein DUF4105